MRRNLLWLILVVAAALIQTTWLEKARIMNVLPDLPLLLILYFALTDGEERAMWTGVIAGLFQDVAGDTVLGHHVLCHILVAFVVGKLSKRLLTEHPAVKLAVVFIACLAHGMLYTAILYVQQPDLPALHNVAARVIPATFYTTLVAPLVFFVLSKWFKRYAPVHGMLD